jgi:hypothetical protein
MSQDKMFESMFDKELKECNTMNQVLDCVQRHYDLDKPLGLATKLLVVTGVKKIIKLIQAVRKKLI